MIKEVSKNLSLIHTREELIINTKAKNECDKLSENNNVTNDLFTETVVQDVTYKQLETECDNVKVIIEFPNQSKNMETVKKEVEQLLASILKEQKIQIQ